MKRRPLLTGSISAFLVTAGCLRPENDEMSQLLILLGGSLEEGNFAYKSLYKIGPRAIPYLVHYAESEIAKKEFQGDAFRNILSSYWIDSVTVDIICLYLVDAITLQKETPYLSPLILRKDESKLRSGNYEGIVDEVLPFYQKWLDTNDKTQTALQSSQYYWYGSKK